MSESDTETLGDAQQVQSLTDLIKTNSLSGMVLAEGYYLAMPTVSRGSVQKLIMDMRFNGFVGLGALRDDGRDSGRGTTWVIAQLWLIWAIALVPMIAAFVMYFGQIGLPEGRTHHGQPWVVHSILTWVAASGRTAKWQVVLASNASCAPCQAFGEGMENFHTALGRERNRVVVSEVQTTAVDRQRAVDLVIDPLGNVV